MKSFIKIAFLFVLLGVSFSASAKGGLKGASSVGESEKQTIELIINGEKHRIADVNPNTRVDVYSIIGSKVTSLEIKASTSDFAITLPKGYYIIKIDDSTRKIAVK